MFSFIGIVTAHNHSRGNREELHKSNTCGCFFCLAIFKPYSITEWLVAGKDRQGTARCPNCGVDAVIGSGSGYPITEEFLSAMETYWFGDEFRPNHNPLYIARSNN